MRSPTHLLLLLQGSRTALHQQPGPHSGAAAAARRCCCRCRARLLPLAQLRLHGWLAAEGGGGGRCRPAAALYRGFHLPLLDYQPHGALVLAGMCWAAACWSQSAVAAGLEVKVAAAGAGGWCCSKLTACCTSWMERCGPKQGAGHHTACRGGAAKLTARLRDRSRSFNCAACEDCRAKTWPLSGDDGFPR